MMDRKFALLALFLAASVAACNEGNTGDSGADVVPADVVDENTADTREDSDETTITYPSQDDRFGEAPLFEAGDQRVEDPFVGIRLVHRETDTPRPLSYHVVLIDPGAEGVDFTLTVANGEHERETTRQTTRDFLTETGAQLTFNGHFFRPWPAVDPYADLLGLGAADGDVYSLFEGGYNQAFVTTPEGTVHIVEQAAGDESGFAVDAELDIDDALGASERIVRDGVNTASWGELHPRTAIGVTQGGHAVAIVVDGRQDRFSEGMTTPEVADVLLEFGVVDAINLDGGGSSTLAVANPEPTLVNRPVGYLLPGTERENGSNFAVFAQPNR